MKIETRSKYDAGRVARSLVNSKIDFTFTVHKEEGDLMPHFMFITIGTSDTLVLHVFRNMDDIGILTPTDPMSVEQVKRMMDALDLKGAR